MNSQAIYDLTVENLRRLRFLSEVKAKSFDSERISQGKASSRAPVPVKSTEDECLAILDDANRKVAGIIDREEKRPPIKETIDQRNFWVLREVGVRVSVVAERYGIDDATVRRIRENARKNVETGKPRQRADKQPRSG